MSHQSIPAGVFIFLGQAMPQLIFALHPGLSLASFQQLGSVMALTMP